MSLELAVDKSLRKRLRRIAQAQIDSALEALNGAHPGGRDEAVHEARKHFKRVRALLRMVRPAIGEAAYRQENICFRDAARPLTEVRDAKILVETVDGLAEHFQGQVAPRSFHSVRPALQDNLRGMRQRVLNEQQAFATVTGVIRQARRRVRSWTDVPNKWWSIGPGVEEVYGRAVEAFADADADPTVEKLHEWRKQAKYLRYQLEELRPLWRERVEEFANEADHMSELLGDDHDLAVLRQTLTDDPKFFGNGGDLETLLALIDRRRAELTQEARLLGQRFFQDRPRDFGRRLKGYWRIWRQNGRTTPDEAVPVPISA
jgi:CHAD domain-containing protein